MFLRYLSSACLNHSSFCLLLIISSCIRCVNDFILFLGDVEYSLKKLRTNSFSSVFLTSRVIANFSSIKFVISDCTCFGEFANCVLIFILLRIFCSESLLLIKYFSRTLSYSLGEMKFCFWWVSDSVLELSITTSSSFWESLTSLWI